jgi:hypothetical protein
LIFILFPFFGSAEVIHHKKGRPIRRALKKSSNILSTFEK